MTHNWESELKPEADGICFVFLIIPEKGVEHQVLRTEGQSTVVPICHLSDELHFATTFSYSVTINHQHLCSVKSPVKIQYKLWQTLTFPCQISGLAKFYLLLYLPIDLKIRCLLFQWLTAMFLKFVTFEKEEPNVRVYYPAKGGLLLSGGTCQWNTSDISPHTKKVLFSSFPNVQQNEHISASSITWPKQIHPVAAPIALA